MQNFYIANNGKKVKIPPGKLEKERELRAQENFAAYQTYLDKKQKKETK